MYDNVLSRARKHVLQGEYYVSFHAEEEMLADDLTVYDLESVMLSGRIVERQRDRAGYKYVIVGETTAWETATVVVKLVGTVVVITVFTGLP